ncbi:hypothetical protein GCM10010409_38440 [Mycolicibacterium diernhoferi]
MGSASSGDKWYAEAGNGTGATGSPGTACAPTAFTVRVESPYPSMGYPFPVTPVWYCDPEAA